MMSIAYFVFADSALTPKHHSRQIHQINVTLHEVLQFLDDSKKDLEMLNRYPLVKKLFVQHNAVLPSSAPVERLFSFAGMITRPHRRSLSDKTFEELLFLKANDWLCTVKLALLLCESTFKTSHSSNVTGLWYYSRLCRWCFKWHLLHVICDLK